jgi:RNA polymerase sigma-70 factor (ECF subfamily)
MAGDPSAARFPTTCWSRVARAGGAATPDAHAALSELCAIYWYPIYAMIRLTGRDAEDAVDLTQDFFARLLEKGTIGRADASRGRFRAFLRTDCRFFLADRRDHDGAAKRGGRLAILPIEAANPEARYRLEPRDDLTPERLFDRAWAMALLNSVFGRLRREYEAAGKAALFDRLRGVLAGESGDSGYPAIAAELGMTAAAIESAARRLRQRYREALREAIAATVDDPADLDDEIRDLFAALRR